MKTLSIGKMSNSAKRVWCIAGICVALAGLVWAVFGQTVSYRFVNFDDGAYVYRNPAVIGGITVSGIKWAFPHVVAANWHPLTMLWHIPDCFFYARAPGGYRLRNAFL